jgi:hypothetical protein
MLEVKISINTGFANHQLIELSYLKSAHSVNTDSVAVNVQSRRTGQLRPGGGTGHALQNAGRGGLGISTSLATAKLLGDMLLNRTSELAYEPYLPSRALHHA